MIKQELAALAERLDEAWLECKFELEGMPEGKLLHASGDGYHRYYQAILGSDGYTRKGITSDHELVQQLARKAFLQKLLAHIEKNKALLDKTRVAYKPCDPDDIVDALTATYQTLPRETFFNPLIDRVVFSLDADERERIRSHAEWGAQTYKPADYMSEGRKLVTSRGERMRSKAEVLIAEKLYEFGIPFRYEQEVCVGTATFHPDFTFEGRGGELFYLEFCGMMDDPSYVEAHKRKMESYQGAGIVPWKNIIYVYASGNEMDMRHIVSVIRNQIIPWL